MTARLTIRRSPDLFPLLLFGLSACGDRPSDGRAAAAPLVLLDSVRIEESESLFVTKPNAITVGADGSVFLSDIGERRVMRVRHDGRGLQVVARTGDGPGEVSSPSALAVLDDSLLVVRNAGGKRLEFFDVATGLFRMSRHVTSRVDQFGASGHGLLMASVWPDSGSGFATLQAGDTLPRRGGSVPAMYLEHPPLAAAFATAALAHDDDDVLGIFEVSNALYRWTAEGAIDSLILRPVTRRGARPDIMLQMMREPARAATLAFQWSIPLVVAPLPDRRTAVVFFEPSRDGQDFIGPYFLQFADWSAHQSCEEIRLPVPEDTPARFAFRGDTLTAVVQHPPPATSQSAESGSTWLLRWRVSHTPCRTQS